MTDPLVGKRLGKLLVLERTMFPDDDPRRRKYGAAYRVRCDCGVEKLIPRAGAAGNKSCGCSRYDHNKVQANETARHFPNRVLEPKLREQRYADI